MQIPALINAIVSLQMKTGIHGSAMVTAARCRFGPGCFRKEVSGSAWINPDGLLERMMGTAVITGKDVQETSMSSFEVLFSLKDINSTTVVNLT